jgi:hypothetical protein
MKGKKNIALATANATVPTFIEHIHGKTIKLPHYRNSPKKGG